MKKLKEFLIERKNWLFVMFITVAVVLLPYSKNSLAIGDDIEFHLGRMQALADSIQNREFPVKIYADMAQTYGYGAGFFYPGLFMYIPAIFIAMGISVVSSYKIFIVLMTVLLFVITYYSIKYITQETNSALIGTILVVTARVVSINLYNRFAIGEFLGYIFLPPIIAGLYDLSDKDFKKPWLLFIGFFGIVNSHLISTLIALVFAIGYFIVTIRKMTLKKFNKLVIVALLVLMSTSYFWVPMLEQMSIQTYRYSNPWNRIENEGFDLWDGFANQIRSIGISFTILVPVLLYALIDGRISRKTKCFIITPLIVLLILITPSIWTLLKDFVQLIQFKWRLLGIITVLFSVAIALTLKEYGMIYEIKIERILAVVLIVSVYITTVLNNCMAENFRNPLDYENVRFSKGTLGIGCEYLPEEMNYDKVDRYDQAKDNEGNVVEIVKKNLQSEFVITKDMKSVEIPYIYYYGYVGNVTDENGNVEPLKIEKSDNGQVEIITEGKEGKVSVWYNGTKIQKISYLVTAFSAIFVLGLVILKRIKMRKNNMEKI